MANYDLTPRIAPNLDRHLVFPLLEFLQERQLYADEDILKAKIELLNNTNMVDYAMDIHKSLYHTDDVPQDMVERRVEVVGRLKALEEAATPLVSFLQNPNAVQELRADKQYNLQMLNERYQIGPEQIESFATPLNQVQSRIWLMHWSLFIFFNHDNGRTQIIDLFNQDKYLNAIQTNAPHLLRYLATSFIVNKRRRPQFKDFIKVIQQEQYSHEDPITEFLACIYVNYDFDAAQKKMKECEERVLAEKLNLNYDEAERWIVNLIRTSKLDAKIDSELGTVIMEPNHPNVYEQLIDHTKALSGRTYKLVSQLLEHSQGQTAR
ncbi:Eukaryotic translation initiation factor 3 subunit E like [Actinidia chinensis var. chinensis]|uniref:Eukaryotic translation initiation factor 3 subunit E n=1 Tax=Actinidia chinensis var. chinensis TaxID=1590841 RepID=A0A2R6RU47_ACTCC|nr:Eukaryotic translation initiation factor 3 subunit E like [Actinidia chinensis var. chinensis]